tara:strand:- start:2294 stop:2395 length:102 start_codon:yes stop_codon:yes gene_type:complete
MVLQWEAVNAKWDEGVGYYMETFEIVWFYYGGY